MPPPPRRRVEGEAGPVPAPSTVPDHGGREVEGQSGPAAPPPSVAAPPPASSDSTRLDQRIVTGLSDANHQVSVPLFGVPPDAHHQAVVQQQQQQYPPYPPPPPPPPPPPHPPATRPPSYQFLAPGHALPAEARSETL